MPTTGSQRALHVIAYHYVRNAAANRFPRLHALGADAFRSQLGELQSAFEMATVESALAFIAGRYQPPRDLCLLTFDDGLREHFDEVFPSLRERGIQGVFFLVTACLDGEIATVHQNHFLMAQLGVDEYRRRVRDLLTELDAGDVVVDPSRACATYRWDSIETAEFKYLLNFALPESVARTVIGRLFADVFGDPGAFARELYIGWTEAATMQAERMAAGGHTHTHALLSRLSPLEQRRELITCTTMLRQRLPQQTYWPFSFPYGKLDSFGTATIEMLGELDYSCAFTSVPGRNECGANRYMLRRIDPKEVGLIGR